MWRRGFSLTLFSFIQAQTAAVSHIFKVFVQKVRLCLFQMVLFGHNWGKKEKLLSFFSVILIFESVLTRKSNPESSLTHSSIQPVSNPTVPKKTFYWKQTERSDSPGSNDPSLTDRTEMSYKHNNSRHIQTSLL